MEKWDNPAGKLLVEVTTNDGEVIRPFAKTIFPIQRLLVTCGESLVNLAISL